MCHGIDATNPDPWLALSREYFDELVSIAADMGFVSINYDQLAAWRAGEGELPSRPIMFDFDHPMKSMRTDVNDVLAAHGYTGNLFVNTGMLDKIHSELYPPDSTLQIMTWDELGELKELGWHIGAHTVTHPSLSRLGVEDPSGTRIREELEQCDERLKTCLGVTARDFAFTGTSWSEVAEREVAKRYRFGRLWIIGANYEAGAKTIRFAELAGIDAPDDADGGPPMAARYITAETHPYRLPSVEIQSTLLSTSDAFRRYLEGALEA
jgi:peptidoglycan/xylan/chitin deacetylase (PgdA/CDA1 family)